MENGEEKCQRCGEVDQDRRTLWMACFYEMMELGIPFDELDIYGEVNKKVGEEYKSIFGEHKFRCPTFEKPKGRKEDQRGHKFFTLRVCKDCRADWMTAIKTWFEDTPDPKESCGSGIFIRENGTNREITREEWDRRNPGREPVIIQSEDA